MARDYSPRLFSGGGFSRQAFADHAYTPPTVATPAMSLFHRLFRERMFEYESTRVHRLKLWKRGLVLLQRAAPLRPDREGRVLGSMSRCSSAGFLAAREKLRDLLIAAFGGALISAHNADPRVRVAATR